jgi:hypothetical protein
MLVLFGKKIGNFCWDFLDIIILACFSWDESGNSTYKGVSLSVDFNILVKFKYFSITFFKNLIHGIVVSGEFSCRFSGIFV